MSILDYHLGELEIARNPNHPRHILPRLPEHFESILDIGCGAGQTLIACNLPNTTLVCGLDVDQEVLALGRQLSQDIKFVLGSGEKLPFPDETFDVAISRVALPLMHIPTALREISRVMKPGGHVWFTLHPPSMTWQHTVKALKTGNPKNIIFRFYILTNGLYFHLTGRQFRFPFNRGRCESFQTVSAITKAMQQNGFGRVTVERNRFFAVTAKKEGASAESVEDEKQYARSANIR
jgi:ubiquinone/menaquinone biosynthesis C-methylase UbiE